ncbi:MAG: hypothetical protein GKR87_04625 [Kiritimatiellae bacterium]|nr:hypothetical protein [Kiritimatiellia bacterium]
MNTKPRHKAFPLGWVTTRKNLLLVGGCLDKLCRLRHALDFDWAKLTLIRPEGRPFCDACLKDKRVCIVERNVQEIDVEQADLVIESTENDEIGKQLDTWCEIHRVPLNAMDKVSYCDIHYPALLFRDTLITAIVSGGDAPALSSRLKKELDQYIGPGWATAAHIFSETRNRLPSGQKRTDLLKKLAQDKRLSELIKENDKASIRNWIEDAINRM